MPHATPGSNDPFGSGALQRAIEQMAALHTNPLRQATEQLAALHTNPLRQAAERAAALQTGPHREMADRLAALQSRPTLEALSHQSERIDRVLGATFQSAGSTSLAEVWSEQEAGPGLGTGAATERVIDQLQDRLPELSREAVRWLVIAWATAMVLAYTVYLSMEYPKGFDEVWARVGPPMVIASLANSIFVSNWKRPDDKKRDERGPSA